jgi:hypothetical protein
LHYWFNVLQYDRPTWHAKTSYFRHDLTPVPTNVDHTNLNSICEIVYVGENNFRESEN